MPRGLRPTARGAGMRRQAAFAAARAAGPDDGPALALMERIHVFKANPPAAEWDGAWHLERK